MKIKETSLYVMNGQCEDAPVEAIIIPVKNEVETAENSFCSIFEGQKIAKIISTVVMDKRGEITPESLRRAAHCALKHAEKAGCVSIAFAPLAEDPEQIPWVGEAKIIVQEILKWLKFKKSVITDIYFCIPDEAMYHVFKNTVSGYVTHIHDTLGDGPYVTVDIIIEQPEGIVLIERSNPPYGWALPGGFVDYGESVERAAAREAKEETNLDLEDLTQFHVYSDPNRDPRFHTISTVFVAKGKGDAAFGDDAKGLMIVKYEELLTREYAFDHKSIIEDYLARRKEASTSSAS